MWPRAHYPEQATLLRAASAQVLNTLEALHENNSSKPSMSFAAVSSASRPFVQPQLAGGLTANRRLRGSDAPPSLSRPKSAVRPRRTSAAVSQSNIQHDPVSVAKPSAKFRYDQRCYRSRTLESFARAITCRLSTRYTCGECCAGAARRTSRSSRADLAVFDPSMECHEPNVHG